MQKRNPQYPLQLAKYQQQSVMAPKYIRKAYEKLGKTPPPGSRSGNSGTSSQPTTPPGSQSGGTGGSDTSTVNWANLLLPAKEASETGVNTWAAYATLKNGVVESLSAIGRAGCLTSGVDFRPTISSALQEAGATLNIAEDFADGLWGAWKDWYQHYMIPGLPWYPAFVAFPGRYAPPMPNVPSPVISGTSSGSATLLAPSVLADKIATKIGSSTMSQSGAEDFVNAFATSFSGAFAIWLGTAQWLNVLGEGPVPTFAPPYVPVGPVIGGTFSGSEGCLSGTFNIVL